MRHDRQLSLDLVRGLAILLVLIFHLYQPTGHAWLDTAMQPVVVAGWAGVDLFFVLSGYLVGGMILSEVAREGRLATGRFFLRRALRLWPVLWLYLAALLLIGRDWATVWPVLIHLQNYVGTHTAPSHLWSLAVEEHFYLLAAFALPPLARGGPRRLIGGLIAVIVAVGTARIAALDAGESLRHAQWQTQYRIDAPAVGVLLAAVRRYHPALFARLSHQRSVLCALALAGFGWLATGTEDTIRYGIGLCIAWASSAALVLAAADARVPSRLVPLARPLGALGLIAYSVYVWHPSAGQPAGVIVQAFGWTDPLAIVLARIGGAILVGALIYRLVEQPFLRLRDRPSMSKAPIQIMRSDCKRAI